MCDPTVVPSTSQNPPDSRLIRFLIHTDCREVGWHGWGNRILLICAGVLWPLWMRACQPVRLAAECASRARRWCGLPRIVICRGNRPGQAGYHPGGLAQRQPEQNFDRQAELDSRIGKIRRKSGPPITRRVPSHVLVHPDQSLATPISRDPHLRSTAL